MPTINLMGPNAAQGMDLQAQQLQLAQAQKIAEVMLSQGLDGGGATTIRTAVGNPYSRDVANWAGPLGAALKTIVGQSNLGDVNSKQLELAQAIIDQRNEGMAQMAQAGRHVDPTFSSGPGDQSALDATGGGPPLPSTTMTNPGQKGGLGAAALAGLSAASPEVRQLAGSILSKQMDLEGKNMLTPEALAALAGRGNVDMRSIPSAISAGDLTGGPMLTRPENLAQKPTVVQTAPGTQTSLIPLGGAGAAVPSVITNDKTYAPGARLPDGSVNNTGLTLGPNMKPIDEASPANKMQMDVGKDWSEKLNAGHDQGQAFITTAPAMIQMIKLTDNLAFGGGGDALNKARQWAMTLGLTKDDSGKIVDAQTFIKYMMPAMAAQLNSISRNRPNNNEFMASMNAAAATMDTDPRTAVNVLHKYITDGLNGIETHTQNINAASKLPQIGPEQAGAYKLMLSPEDVLGNLGKLGPINYKRIPGPGEDVESSRSPAGNGGVWMSPEVGTEKSHEGARGAIDFGGAKGKIPTFATVDAAKAAGLPVGSKVIVDGKMGTLK